MNVLTHYRLAATLLFVSAALHLPLFALVDIGHWMPLAFVTLLWVALAVGLRQGWRWVAYLSFLAMLTGAITALAMALPATGALAVLMWVILAVDVSAAAVLFKRLWSAPADRPARA
jgi:hypothetical protein